MVENSLNRTAGKNKSFIGKYVWLSETATKSLHNTKICSCLIQGAVSQSSEKSIPRIKPKCDKLLIPGVDDHMTDCTYNMNNMASV